MKTGSGKSKGNSFERSVNSVLSLWISHGARADLLTRNILSGGRFTKKSKAGDMETGIPGDTMPAHPLGFKFCSLFSVECKFHARLHVGDFLLDSLGKSFLLKTYKYTELQAATLHLFPLVIAKENQRPAFVLMPSSIGRLALEHAFPKLSMVYHKLHNDTIWYVPFLCLTTVVRPQQFLDSALNSKAM
jgi:hypothetical protein